MTALQLKALLRRNVVWVVLVALACGLAAFAFASRNATYHATARVILHDAGAGTNALTGYAASTDLQSLVTTQVPVVASPAVLRQAAGAADRPPDELRDNLTVVAQPAAAALTVSVANGDAQRAAREADAIAEAYVSYRGGFLADQYRTAAAALSKRMTNLLRNLASVTAEAQAPADPTALTDDPLAQPAAPDPTAVTTPTPADPSLAARRSAIRRQYTVAFGQRQTLLAQAAATESDAEIISPAVAPSVPDRSPKRFALLGVVVGLVLALLLVLLRNHLDDRIFLPDDLSPELRRRLLVEIPRLGRRRDHDRALALDALRGAWMQIRLTVEHPVRSVVVASARDGEGKTFVARNVAEAIAEIEPNVVLVSADLRSDAMERSLGVAPEAPGLTTLLAAEAHGAEWSDLSSLLVPVSGDGLRFLPSGPAAVRPSILLDRRVVEPVLARLAQVAGVVVIDTSSLDAAPEALGVIEQSDLVLLVASTGSTRVSELRQTTEAIGRAARAAAILLNRTRRNRLRAASPVVTFDVPARAPAASEPVR